MFEQIASHYNYWIVVGLMMTGLYITFSTGNLIKKLVGLGVFQTSVFLLYISISKVARGQAPILEKAKKPAKDAAEAGGYPGVNGYDLDIVYSNALPHVLILTAIVVGVATLAVGLALVVRIRESYGTIEDDEINEDEYNADVRGADV